MSILISSVLPDFPCSPVVKNPPVNAGSMGLIPSHERLRMALGNQAQVPQLLSLCPRAREPQLLSQDAPTAKAATTKSRCQTPLYLTSCQRTEYYRNFQSTLLLIGRLNYNNFDL